jgi:hypothetical protein
MVISMIEENKVKKTLSIRISTNGFCFCSYTPSDPESLRFSTYTPDEEQSMASNIQTAIQENPLIRKNEEYDIKVIMETGTYTCIPTEYDNKAEYTLIFRQCFPATGDNVEIVANRLNAQGYTILFPVEKSIQETLQQLGEVTFYTPASIIMGYLNYKPIDEERYMLMYMYNSLAFMLTMKNGKAGISNIFRKEDNESTLFYLLSIWKEEGLSQTGDALYLCGDRSIEEFTRSAERFIKRIKRIIPNEMFQPSLLNRIEGIPFDLQALILCG